MCEDVHFISIRQIVCVRILGMDMCCMNRLKSERAGLILAIRLCTFLWLMLRRCTL